MTPKDAKHQTYPERGRGPRPVSRHHEANKGWGAAIRLTCILANAECNLPGKNSGDGRNYLKHNLPNGACGAYSFRGSKFMRMQKAFSGLMVGAILTLAPCAK